MLWIWFKIISGMVEYNNRNKSKYLQAVKKGYDRSMTKETRTEIFVIKMEVNWKCKLLTENKQIRMLFLLPNQPIKDTN